VFTTLTTVGLGDYYPVGNIERLFGVVMMFVGTMIFSLVIGIYGEILEKFKLIEEEFDEGSELSLFMEVIKHFNHNHGLKKQVRDEIEDYFSYRWKKHNHLPFESPEGIRFSGKIPVGEEA